MMRKLILLFTLTIYAGIMWAQYPGSGNFEKITSTDELSDGYYVIAEADDEYAMNNDHNGTFLDRTEISPNSGTITNPSESIVWLIETNGSGHLVYNEEIEKYVSYTGSSNDVQIVDDVESDNQRWDITYDSDVFSFTNIAVDDRILQYNASAPRFVCYTSNQRKLHLYKYDDAGGTTPFISVSPDELDGFSYDEGDGPSAEQTFTVEGTDLTDDVSITAPADFEISETSGSGFGSTVTLTESGGTVDETTIYVRLSAGLTIGNYSGDIELTSTDADTETVALSGSVSDPNVNVEDFSNSNADGSYDTDSFIGNNGIEWSYVESRDANNDANGSGIDLPALMLRWEDDGSKVYSETISGGIGNFSVKLYKGFTGGGDRQVELFINGESKGTSEPFDDYNEHVFEVDGINISGNIEIRIDNITSKQVIVDDITWTPFDDGGNTPPSISNITQTPEEVTSSDAVSVTADITDSDGTIQTAELHWGTDSDDLTETISMSSVSGDTYETDSDIPAQDDGTTVYYEVYAMDDGDAETTSSEHSYTVTDPATIPFTESFDDSEWPAGWTYEDFIIENENNAGGSPNEASLGFFNAEAGVSHITTLQINTSGEDELILSWKNNLVFYGEGGTEYTVEVQTSNDGSSFDPVWSQTVTEDINATTESVVLDAADGIGAETFYVKWILTEDDGSFSYWNIDNISLSADTPATFENITIDPQNPTSSDPVAVSADVTDEDGLASVSLNWGTESGSLTNNIPMSNTSDDTYETDSDIPAQDDETTAYFEIVAEDDGGNEAASSEQSYTVTDPATATLPYSQPFDADLDDMYTYNSIGDEEWEWNEYGENQYARMSGHDGSNNQDNVDWLITPEFDFSGDVNTVLNFDEAINFGTDNLEDEQEIYISTDYAGIGDPETATWTKLTVTGRAEGNSYDFVSVDQVDLSAYDGEASVHIAFKYISTTDGAANWDVDNISVEQLGEDGQITVTSPNGGESWEQGTSHDITWTSANLTGDVKIELQGDDTEVLAEATEDDGVFTWDIPADQPVADNYLIVITSVDDETVSDASDETFSITAPYVPGDLVITEIMYNPPEAGSDSLEYLEVYNFGDFDVNLEGYYFEGVSFTFPDVTLAADDYIVVAINQNAFENFFGGTALEWSSGALSNGGETVSLYDFDGTLIDEVPYGDGEPWPEAADGDGPSLTLCDPSLDNTLAENWSASDEYAGMNDEEAMVFGTPGAPCGDLNMVADFEALETEIGVGENATFIDLTTEEATYWEWEFEGGEPATSNIQNPDNITYNEAGTYDVTLTVYNETGTTSVTKEDYISVVSGPEADFSADVTTVAVDGEVTFMDESEGDPTSWEWEFEGGDPASYSGQNPPTVSYAAEGTYDVTLTVSNEYGESTEVKTDYIEVTAEPAANFEATETILIAGESTTFEDLSSGDPTSWEWTFEGGDPETYSGQNPPEVTYENTGSYDVTLIVSNEAGENTLTREEYIIVGLEPVADFESSAQNIVEGTTIEFTDLSENEPDSWSWSFNGGTPSSSGLQNPEVTYNDFGVYSVILEVSNMFGSDTEAKVDYIAVDADGIEELSLDEEKMIVYPNPAVDMVNVVLHSGLQGTITLRSATGNKVMEKTILKRNAEFNINNLPQGIYFVEFIDEESHQRITKRLIVK